MDSGWIIASVLWIICARCLPYYSRDMKRRIEKITPKRKCKFIDDWRRDFAWIAKLPMAWRSVICVTDFSISSGGRTYVRRHQESACHGESTAII